MTQFEKAIKEIVLCDICGEIMHPVYGSGWDNDIIACSNIECQAEIVYPTSTEVPKIVYKEHDFNDCPNSVFHQNVVDGIENREKK